MAGAVTTLACREEVRSFALADAIEISALADIAEGPAVGVTTTSGILLVEEAGVGGRPELPVTVVFFFALFAELELDEATLTSSSSSS